MLVRDCTTQTTPLSSGDPRPGRPVDRPVVLVVDANPTARLRTRNDLTARGFDVVTCPGPAGGAACPAASAASSCARVAPQTRLVVLAEPSAELESFYARQLPDADIRTGHNIDLSRA